MALYFHSSKTGKNLAQYTSTSAKLEERRIAFSPIIITGIRLVLVLPSLALVGLSWVGFGKVDCTRYRAVESPFCCTALAQDCTHMQCMVHGVRRTMYTVVRAIPTRLGNGKPVACKALYVHTHTRARTHARTHAHTPL